MSIFLLLLGLFLLLHLPPLARRPALATARQRAAVAAGFFFIVAGALHFLMPQTYLKMMPPALPYPLFLVYLSGACEMLGGAGLLIPPTRRAAAWGLILLLLAVLPANVHVAMADVPLEALPYPRWYFWLRTPFQAVYLAWVAWAGGLWPLRRAALAR